MKRQWDVVSALCRGSEERFYVGTVRRGKCFM